MSGEIQTEIDRGYLAPETRADAASYLTRTGNADLLPILGLTGDPEAAQAQQAKARALLGGRAAPPMPPGYRCGVCRNRLPTTGACRRSGRCRVVLAEWQDTKQAGRETS